MKTSKDYGYEGRGWYTFTQDYGSVEYTSDGAVWVMDEDDFTDWARMADEDDEPRSRGCEYDRISGWYHGSGVLPDECMDPDRNSWVDVDPFYLKADVYEAMTDLATAKAGGDDADVARAMDALEALG